MKMLTGRFVENDEANCSLRHLTASHKKILHHRKTTDKTRNQSKLFKLILFRGVAGGGQKKKNFFVRENIRRIFSSREGLIYEMFIWS